MSEFRITVSDAPCACYGVRWQAAHADVMHVLTASPGPETLQNLAHGALNHVVFAMLASGHRNVDAVDAMLMPLDRDDRPHVQSACWRAGKRMLDGDYATAFRLLDDVVARLERAGEMLTPDMCDDC